MLLVADNEHSNYNIKLISQKHTILNMSTPSLGLVLNDSKSVIIISTIT